MLWWLTETTVVSAALAGAVAVLCRRLRPRPAVRHALWLLVLLRLLMPPLLAWPWPQAANEMAPRPPPAELVFQETISEAIDFPTRDDPAAEPEPAEPANVLAEPGPALAHTASPPVTQGNLRLDHGLLSVWIAGAVLMAVVQLVRVLRFRARVSRGGPAPGFLTEEVATLARRLGVRPPPVRMVPGLASPVVWGLGRPQLLWPAALTDRLSADGRCAAVIHELAHLRRRDHWVGWLQLFGSCVWWWNPIFWHVRRQLGRAAELACDACVIELLPRARRAYAEALLQVCELVTRHAVPAPALGMGGARQEIERRLNMILRESVPSRLSLRALFGVVLLGLIALPGFTDGQDSNATRPPDEKPAPAVDEAVLRNVVVAPVDATRPAVDEREQRLQKLEASLDALLKEVRQMRGATKQPADSTPKASWKMEAKPYQTQPGQPGAVHKYEYQRSITSSAAQGQAKPEQAIHLCRITYMLAKDKAEALAAVLKDVKMPVLETAVKADGIVVTTTPEGQRIIGDFVGLLQGKTSAATGHYPSYSAPSNYAPAKK
jgi:beta-lactamase regulating signal transducer with metallopeptidase domain